MTLQFFTNIFTFVDDDWHPIKDGVRMDGIRYVTFRARTNGFMIANQLNAIDGYTVASGTFTIPGQGIGGQQFSLDDLYWSNSTKDGAHNAVIEVFGARETLRRE